MKRGFDKCTELKKECGSQFLQYLAKTALASGLATKQLKLDIFEYDTEYQTGKSSCAGCGIPTSLISKVEEYCRHGCGVSVHCDWKFCKPNHDAHVCVTCGDTTWCCRADEGNINRCFKCKRFICGKQECYSDCKDCSKCFIICKSCAGPTTTYTTIIGTDQSKTGQYCNLHKQNLIQDEQIILQCKECSQTVQTLTYYCRDYRCCRIICPHQGSHYCSEHAGDHK